MFRKSEKNLLPQQITYTFLDCLIFPLRHLVRRGDLENIKLINIGDIILISFYLVSILTFSIVEGVYYYSCTKDEN